MGLTAPLALLAAFAVLLPIAAHLAKQRDLPRVTFPALSLLQLIESQNKRRVRLKDRGLLALRALIVLAVAFGAAAPFLWSDSAFRDGQVSSLVILLDDSMSTQGHFDALVGRARAAVDALPAGSEVSLVAAGRPARTLLPLSAERDAARLTLASIEASARGTDLAGAATLAASELSRATQMPRLLVLSDFPQESETVGWPRNAELAFERFGPAAVNTAVLDATMAPDPTRPGTTSVRVLLAGPAGPVNVALITPDGDTLAEETVSISSEGRTSALLSATVGDELNALRIVVRTGPSELITFDDERLVLAHGVARRVLVVDGDSAQGEARFIARALHAAPALAGGGRIAFRVIDIDRLRTTPLGDFDLVILANAVAPESMLRPYLDSGGGILVSGGDRLVRGAMLSMLPARIGEARGGNFQLNGLRLDGARASRVLSLEPSAGAEIPLRWSDGTPALVQQGPVAILGTTLDDDWTDLPFQPGFIALLHRLIGSLTEGRPLGGTYEAGAIVPVLEGSSVTGPEVEADVGGTFDRTGLPGLYTARAGDITSEFVVVPASGDSTARPGAMPAEREAGATEGAARSKEPMAPWVFFVAGLFLVAEGLVRTRRRQRPPQRPIRSPNSLD